VSLELLRGRRTWPLMRLLERRLDSEKKSGTPESIGALMAEQERWTTLVRGGLLPTFFQVPPAAFTLKAAGQPVRVLAFGDYGDGGEPQKRVAAAMLRQHQVRPFDFAITLGDNFYPAGMDSPSDARWDTWWSALYDPLKIHFYVSMGNHDWNQSNSPAAEILFSQRSPSWRLPSAYYTFHAGPVQFFALDTDIMSQAQLQWLASALDSSRAAWKVVYGHHPVYSAGQHGDSAQKIRDLLPVVKDRADVYIAGHDHDMQHLRPEGRVHFFVAGSGGKIRPIQPGPRSLFARSANGFAVIDADERALTVSFVETDLSSPYSYTITRSGTSSGQTASPAPPRR
jgi:hypothetical protein